MNSIFEIKEYEVLDEKVTQTPTNNTDNSKLDRYLLPCMIALSVLFLIIGLATRISESRARAGFSEAHASPTGKPVNVSATPITTTAPTATPTTAPTATLVPTATPTIAPTQTPAAKAIIVIDAGHGGFDPGTVGTNSGVLEKDVNLKISLYVQQYLEEAGYSVIMTRTTEGALADGKEGDMSYRCNVTQTSNADMFISIHQNAFPDNPNVCGPEIYYHPTSTVAKPFGECILKQLDALAGTELSRGVKSYDHTVTKVLPYSILIECGFLTNPTEEQRLISAEYQMQIAKAIVRGVDDFYATGVFSN